MPKSLLTPTLPARDAAAVRVILPDLGRAPFHVKQFGIPNRRPLVTRLCFMNPPVEVNFPRFSAENDDLFSGDPIRDGRLAGDRERDRPESFVGVGILPCVRWLDTALKGCD